jgi:hypothetical protein
MPTNRTGMSRGEYSSLTVWRFALDCSRIQNEYRLRSGVENPADRGRRNMNSRLSMRRVAPAVAVIMAGTLFDIASPAMAEDSGAVASTTQAKLSATEAAGRLSPVRPFDNPRCTTPRQCYGNVQYDNPVALDKCTKMAIANGSMAAGATALTTTPIDWVGVTALKMWSVRPLWVDLIQRW